MRKLTPEEKEELAAKIREQQRERTERVKEELGLDAFRTSPVPSNRELTPEKKEELTAKIREQRQKRTERMKAEFEKAEKEREERKKWSKYALIFFSAAGLCFLLILIARGVGKEIYKSKITVSEGYQGVTLDKEVYFEKPGIPHRIDMKGTIKPNTWCDVELSLLDENEQYLFSLGDCFWDEEGTDEEGYWHESDTKHSLVFIPNDAGKHYFHVTASSENLINIEVSVFQGVLLLRYFLISAIIFSIAACYTGARAHYGKLSLL